MSGWMPPQDVDMTPELLASIKDKIGWAYLKIAIGQDPDDTQKAFSQAITMPSASPVCLKLVANILRELADSFDGYHAENGCTL